MSKTPENIILLAEDRFSLRFNPFPGLRPFTNDESHLFFGREGQSEEVLVKLSRNRFVAVLGASGSGKSSLMYCGVLPILQGGFLTETGSIWRVITTRPGTSPIDNLAVALASNEKMSQEKELDIQLLENVNKTVLRSSSYGLIEAIRHLKIQRRENILILVDQFEELFRFKSMRIVDAINETEAFVKLLVEAQQQQEVPIYVMLTMRSDFMGDCSNFQNLTKLINESHYLIPQMTREDFRSAIVGPVAVGGGEIDAHLVQQLLNDVGDNPDQLPILQHAMMRTWDYWLKTANGTRPINLGDYDAIGKLHRALSEHANEAYDELDLEGRRICQIMFKSLTERGNDNRGIRRPTAISEIMTIAGAGFKEVVYVINKFRREGRSFLSPSYEIEIDKTSVLDISHESLMRIWDKLKLWVDEEASDVQLYSRLCESAALYQEGRSGLWRPPDLQLALNWRDNQKPTLAWATRYNPAFERAMVYLETSEREFTIEEENKIRQQKRQLRRSKIFALVLGSAAIISLGFLLFSLILRQEAEKQRLRAENQSVEANKQKEIAEKESKKAEEQRRIAESNAEEALLQKQEADKQRSFALISAEEAKRQEQIARQKSNEAIQQRELAELNAKEANEQRITAEKAKNEAYKRRMLSISQSMAVKAQTYDLDIEVKSLLAYQAFKFNEVYGGYDYNPDIYLGLYFASKAQLGEKYNILTNHKGSIRKILFSPSGIYMYTIASDGKILRWQNEKGTFRSKLIYQSGEQAKDLIINDIGNMLAMLSINNNLYIVHIADTLVVKREIPIKSNIEFMKFRKGEPIIEIAARDTSLYEYNFANDSIWTGRNLSGELAVMESAESNEEIYVTKDNSIFILHKDWEEQVHIKDLRERITKVAYSSKAKMLAIGDIKGNIFLYKPDKSVNIISGHRARVSGLAFGPKGELMASVGLDGIIQIISLNNLNEQPVVINEIGNWITSLAFSKEGDKIIFGTVDNNIHVIPSKSKYFINTVKANIKRNFTLEEWRTFVAPDVPHEQTINGL